MFWILIERVGVAFILLALLAVLWVSFTADRQHYPTEPTKLPFPPAYHAFNGGKPIPPPLKD